MAGQISTTVSSSVLTLTTLTAAIYASILGIVDASLALYLLSVTAGVAVGFHAVTKPAQGYTNLYNKLSFTTLSLTLPLLSSALLRHVFDCSTLANLQAGISVVRTWLYVFGTLKESEALIGVVALEVPWSLYITFLCYQQGSLYLLGAMCLTLVALGLMKSEGVVREALRLDLFYYLMSAGIVCVTASLNDLNGGTSIHPNHDEM